MKRYWIAVVILTILSCAALAALYKYWQGWLAYETGSRNTGGAPPNYNYWSGFGSVFPWSMGIIAALVHNGYVNARKSNCHTHGCWRIGSLPVGDYKVCRKHHLLTTGTRVTVEHLHEHHLLHHRAKKAMAEGIKP